MLCQFTVENYRSYRKKTTFDFQAVAISEFKDTLIQTENGRKFLPVSVIYGPNGGGKTNLLRALACVVTMVVSPVVEIGKNRVEYFFQNKTDYEPFLFNDKSKKKPTSFEIYFRTFKNEYRYFISVYDDEIVEEQLYWKSFSGKKPGMIFERRANNIELGMSIDKKSISKSVNPKMPYLSFLAINYNIDVINDVVIWFESCIIRNYANAKTEHDIVVFQDKKGNDSVINALQSMDINIDKYWYNEDDKNFYTRRTIDGKEYELKFVDESEGTKKLVSILPLLIMALNQGRLVVMDELDAKLHPKLLKFVIEMFKDKKINKYGAQLVFTSHDMSTMKNTVFRRDEIWLSALNSNHESEIYSLYDIRREDNEHVNSTAAYDKQYLEGRYGADPYLRNMLSGVINNQGQLRWATHRHHG